VEAARVMTSADQALAVLNEERDGTDEEAVLIAMAVLAADGGGAELPDPVHSGIPAAVTVARLALGEETASMLDLMTPAELFWDRAELDLVQRFGGVLAASPHVVRADYARLLRSVEYHRAEVGDQAALAVLVELFVIGDFRDGDAESAAQRFGVSRVNMEELYGAAARRLASTEPRRAAALALESGPVATWVLRDVLQDIASRDLRLAVELTDLVGPQFSGTRSVILGTVGALVDPRDTQVIDALNRRIPPPETSAAVTVVLTDAALRLAAMLPGDDDRTGRLLERFPPDYDVALGRAFRTERAISMAISGDFAAAVELMKENEPTSSADYSTREGWVRLAAHLPAEFASEVLQAYVLPRAGLKRYQVMCTLASIDPMAAIRQLVNPPFFPHTFAAVLRLADENLKDPDARRQCRREVTTLSGDERAAVRFLLWWSMGLTSLASYADGRVLDHEFSSLWRSLQGAGARALVARCVQEHLEPGFFLGAWVYENPRRLSEAVNTVFEGFDVRLASPTLNRVRLLVNAAIHSNVGEASAIIDDVDWPSRRQAELLRDESYEKLAAELAQHDRDAAYRRVRMIRDPWVAQRALAALAAIVATGPAAQPSLSFSDVLAARLRWRTSTIEFARALVSEIAWIDQIELRALVALLAETSAWRAAESAFLFGPLFALLRQDRDAARAAADIILAGYLRS
jgi:hypothetical protein